jgi:hypothetical protein
MLRLHLDRRAVNRPLRDAIHADAATASSNGAARDYAAAHYFKRKAQDGDIRSNADF